MAAVFFAGWLVGCEPTCVTRAKWPFIGDDDVGDVAEAPDGHGHEDHDDALVASGDNDAAYHPQHRRPQFH